MGQSGQQSLDVPSAPWLKWSNGEPITAQDVVWSWKRLVDPKTGSPYATYPGTMHIENANDIARRQKAG
ncbi:Periplasmic oligopeptide-binding protein precursor [Cedecea neteri]|uniref:Periplasmic oligopeptide-binding protein n=1 Tax=Cedecea neteri TaxID=158822 RepID=A0A2X2SSP1_9ENTR|nr:Periplasmic oligopeptide-binding protein precursor [Cedecea neteri]